MRRIESRLILAIENGVNFKQSNTALNWRGERQDVGLVSLFGNTIAKVHSDLVELTDANSRDRITKSRLNAIIRGLNLGRGIYQQKEQWYFSGYGYTVLWSGYRQIKKWKVNRKQNLVNEALVQLGYTDPFYNAGQLWAFPPHAVMALPIIVDDLLEAYRASVE